MEKWKNIRKNRKKGRAGGNKEIERAERKNGKEDKMGIKQD